MKAQSGFTLVELMIVVAIVGIIMAIAIMNLTQTNDRFTVESYTKEIYSTLMRARNDAANSNIQVSVTLAANQVTTYQDVNGNGVADPNETTTKSYPRFTILFATSPIIFDRKGITTAVTNQTISITGYSANAKPQVDCIAVAQTRINMGLMTGGDCVQQ